MPKPLPQAATPISSRPTSWGGGGILEGGGVIWGDTPPPQQLGEGYPSLTLPQFPQLGGATGGTGLRGGGGWLLGDGGGPTACRVPPPAKGCAVPHRCCHPPLPHPQGWGEVPTAILGGGELGTTAWGGQGRSPRPSRGGTQSPPPHRSEGLGAAGPPEVSCPPPPPPRLLGVWGGTHTGTWTRGGVTFDPAPHLWESGTPCPKSGTPPPQGLTPPKQTPQPHPFGGGDTQ